MVDAELIRSHRITVAVPACSPLLLIRLLAIPAGSGANATLTIDLPNQEIRGPDGGKVKFEIDPFRKHCLINGLDDIGLTMEKKSSIDSYEAKLKKERAWA